MKTISRYIMTLALLITAVGGAWADETLTETIITTGYSGSNLTVNGTYFKVSGTQFRSDGGYNGVRIANGKTATISLIDPNSSAKATKIVLYPDGGDTDVQYVKIDGAGTYSSTDVTVSKDVSITNDGSATISWGGNVNYGVSISKIEITYTAGPVVNINDAKTEASFTMPAYDATVDYELVRDMGYKVAFSGVPTRARLAKDGDGKFHFADGLTFQLLDNIDANNPKDITSAEGITFMVGEVEAVDFEGHIFYQLNKETLVPLADFLSDAHLGNYVICAVASTGEYDGSFTSDRITLFQGYEVTVAPGDYATYYREDDALYVDDPDAQLYTITAVSGQTATAEPISVAPAGTPVLVKNNGTADKVLLIPTTTDADVNFYTGFVGTLAARDIPASDAATDRYALNGQQFVWVKNPVSIAANKAWLEVPANDAAGARALTIVFSDETTGINAATLRDMTTGDWYDLNGRKLNNIPTKKGIYIHNGRKVVVK